jgi:hypothetical protein
VSCDKQFAEEEIIAGFKMLQLHRWFKNYAPCGPVDADYLIYIDKE